MVLVLNWPIFDLFSLDNLDHENVFYDILNPENAFSTLEKQKVQKVQK